jgi:hypothetical protein
VGGESLSDHLKWAAGYIDGEGAVMARGRSGVEISVHSTVPQTTDRLHALFGGTRSFEDARSHRHKGQFRWRVYGDRARECARRLLGTGLLLAKVNQALAVRDSAEYPAGTATGDRLREDALDERRMEYGEDGHPRR